MKKNPIEDGTITVQGCPVADGKSPCHGCGGGWPGTQATSDALTKAAQAGRLLPDSLGCGLLVEGAKRALHELQQRGIVFQAPAPVANASAPAAG